ncbi:MAG TPA: protein-methionine-sulfoxide reductase heme-binding subunit MsrQ [Dehalococcoidales bacterium]|nr:protein-methionine-sulfoxide reductase heme-binding subunit MsrQ [Dehalococcoidales bacterium]
MNRLEKYGPPVILNLLALLPLAWLAWDIALGHLSVNPIQDIQIRTGRTAIIMLVVSLAGTPLYRLLGYRWLRLMRRLAGLYGFGYAALHFLNFIGVDYRFNLDYLRADALDKRYAIAGLAALICLLPVAVTSTRGWQRRLGRRWRYWHWLVYPAALLAVTHFFWQAKIDVSLPMVFAALIILLLLLRLPFFRRVTAGLKSRPDTDG